MNATETTLDAVVLLERIAEFTGRTVRFTSHGMDFRGELVTVLDRGNGVSPDRRLTVIMRGNTEAVTGFRTHIAIEYRDGRETLMGSDMPRYADEFIHGPAVADVLDPPHPDERAEF